MNRGLFAALLGMGALTLVLGVFSPALANGNLVLTNATIEKPVDVQVRQGTDVKESFPAAYGSLNKGESLTCDTTNLQYFWRRELNPGSKDGKWTDWARIDTRGGDQKVSF